MKKDVIILSGFGVIVAFVLVLIYLFFVPYTALYLIETYPSTQIYGFLTYIVLYATLVPVLFGLYAFTRLMISLYKNLNLNESDYKLFDYMIYSGYGLSILNFLSLPLFYLVADAEDAPGVLVMAIIVSTIGIGIGTLISLVKRIVISSKREV
ncbi:MAG TPA: DUF2975 domain-containing protein [Bacilli bacterium]|nr:DUF2975 domain-containing protein [Bacilli bacterium]